MRTRLREIRKIRGLTQAELAIKSGYSEGMVSRVENGELAPSEDFAAALCKALGVTPKELFLDEDGGKPGVRKVVLPEATAKRAEEIMARGGYSSLDELVAEAVRRLTGDVQERILKWKDLENGGSAQKG
jgi:transcriptional regulator with XRE-family HTH domain